MKKIILSVLIAIGIIILLCSLILIPMAVEFVFLGLFISMIAIVVYGALK